MNLSFRIRIVILAIIIGVCSWIVDINNPIDSASVAIVNVFGVDGITQVHGND
ncbi:MAG: hypothetical protein LBT10_09215 [Methanobrevibacter sp.]|nr:hypothetical protein [Methanobrevibacter sp.]